MRLKDSIAQIPYIGDKYALKLERLGILNIHDLLYYFPKKYTDSSQIYKFSELSTEEKRTVMGKLVYFKNLKTRRGKKIQKATFINNGDELSVTWFNQPFLENTLELEKTYLIFGKRDPKVMFPQMLAPEVEELKVESKNIGRISPDYDLTEGIKMKWLRARIKWLVDKFEYISDFSETLPRDILEKYKLIGLLEAIKLVHFPKDFDEIQISRERLGFDELLAINLKIEKRREELRNIKSKKNKLDAKFVANIKKHIGFELTEDQEKVLAEIFIDLTKESPMQRLLQGDVGSGKTIVAVIASSIVASSGYKVVYLAPTTILASQIYKVFTEILGETNIHLVSSKSKFKDLPDKNSILIGTHALLFKEENFYENLNLLIIDEEHRFGVKQREKLTEIEKTFAPHHLSMSATPIPRSLAMTIWGDTQISYIKSKPKGRKPTETFFVPHRKEKGSYKWIKDKVKEGHQVFWVCPLISESDKLQAKSAEETFKKIEKEFGEFKVRLVHGKTKDKEEQIEEFKNKKFDILVTTPIIEVGIDIPNANVIVIESTERFGLAQLHQFRGRVGRGKDQGYCLLFSTDTNLTEDQKERIKFFCKTNDGLKLAEFDLKRRGPGEVYGTKQSGIPDLKIANIFDMELLAKTQEAARMILSTKSKDQISK